MKYLKIIIIALILSISGCATTGSQSPKQVAIESAKLFKFKDSHFIWIPSSSGLSGGLASMFVSSAGTDSPYVASLVQIMKSAKSNVVRIGVSGPNSSLTASIIISALENTPGELRNLHLAFIGFREHEAEVRAAVKAKGGEFLFSETKRS
ncbi:MAG: hypothetical protein KAT25_05035 [Sulfuriflexus sp.]|nr:hypothetical protein [Sulfuriflexus sp.]